MNFAPWSFLFVDLCISQTRKHAKNDGKTHYFVIVVDAFVQLLLYSTSITMKPSNLLYPTTNSPVTILQGAANDAQDSGSTNGHPSNRIALAPTVSPSNQDEVVALNEVDLTVLHTKKTKAKNFQPEENELIAKCWLNISEDPIVGTNQTKEIFWLRVFKLFEQNDTTHYNRTVDSIRVRWGHLNCQTSKFIGAYSKVAHKLGSNLETKFKDANVLFAAEVGSNFQFANVWHVLKDKPKYLSFLAFQAKKTTKKTINSNSTTVTDNSVENAGIPERPVGQNKSKEAAAAKTATTKEADNHKAKIAANGAEIAASLKRKANLAKLQYEAAVMSQNINKLNEAQKQWHIIQQNIILAKWSASVDKKFTKLCLCTYLLFIFTISLQFSQMFN